MDAVASLSCWAKADPSREANEVVPEADATSAFPTLDAAMRAHIETALSLTLGRIEGASGAAALLGLNPHTLRGKMRRLAIDWSGFRHRVR